MFNKDDIYRFNLDGAENFWGQVVANHQGKINTWAIFWYATIFQQGGLCLNPVQTYVDNIGIDGSGIHCGTTKEYVDMLNDKEHVVFEKHIKESKECIKVVRNYLKKMALASKIKKVLRWR
jgi:hypothetical protein